MTVIINEAALLFTDRAIAATFLACPSLLLSVARRRRFQCERHQGN